MEGVYVDDDHCLQVVMPTSRGQWTMYGINGCNQGEEVYWTAIAKTCDNEQDSNNIIVESTDGENENKCHVIMEGDMIKWPSGKKWNKMNYSYGQ